MDPTQNQARRAGLLYVMASLAAPFAYLYVPGRLVVPGDALATAERVRASEGLLRAAVVAELISATVLLFAALALYRLFERVDRRAAAVMAVMMLVSVSISFINASNNLAPLVLLKDPAISAVLGAPQIAAAVTLFLRLHALGLVVNQVFWGLWLFPVGLLVLRSGFLPRWLAWPLFAAGAGYVLNSLGALLLPPSQRWMTESLQVLGVGEMPFFSFYLLIQGVRGATVDRVGVLLVVLLFVLGIVGFGLLMTNRIGAAGYAVMVLGKLLLVAILVLRWRRWEGRTGSAVAAA